MLLTKKKLVLLFLITGFLLTNNRSYGQQFKANFNPDSSQIISLKEFNSRVDRATELLESKVLSAIGDTDHINIMMCLNTISITDKEVGSIEKRFTENRYQRLQLLADKKNYVRDIGKIYPEYTYNRGLGFYFLKLKMELHGTPRLYAIFTVTK